MFSLKEKENRALPVFTIRRKITFCFLVLAVIMSSVFALISYFRIIKAMHTEIEKHGIEVVEILSQTIAPYVFDSDYMTVMDIVENMIEYNDIQSFSIVNPDGEVWFSTVPEKFVAADKGEFYASVLRDKHVHFRTLQLAGGSAMEFVSPITALGKVAYLLKIEMSLERLEKEAFDRIRENVVIGLLMISAAAILAIYLASLLTGPLEKLVRGTKELALGNLSHRIPVEASDEIGLLSNSFNSMAASLEKESSIRREAESKLKRHSSRLEEKVAERTALLTDTNRRLSDEIRKHRSTEAALVEANERYRRFSEVTLDGIVIFNIAGIIDVNSSFTEMFGYSREAIVGEDFLEIVCQPELIDEVRHRLSMDADKYIETTAITRAGKHLDIEIQCRILEDGDTSLSGYFIRDISSRKQLEAQLKQAQKMESIGKLAAGIAHDLNNILSGIVTIPQLLMLDIPEDSPLRESIELMQKSGDSAAVIVQDMLTLAKSGLNHLDVVNPKELVVSYILSPESTKLRQTHPEAKIRLDIDESVCNIKGSPVHLKKLLMNLVYNAVDAIEGEGEVVIALNNRYLDRPLNNYEEINAGSYVCLSVKDTGTGISPEDIPMIFEPFYSKKIPGRSGTGLGMAIVWNTVNDHQGYIDIKSGVNVGTQVDVYIPVTQDTMPHSETKPDLLSLKGNREVVLVVDDIAEQRKVASAILEKLNYQPRSVAGGEYVVDFLKEQPVDLILLDMIMEPGIDGLEACKRIFALDPDAKVIITSGFAESKRLSEALDLGALQYIKKPYSIMALGAAIREALHGKV